ncbi:hypothetical protein [Rickettsiella massiliensis]|uniref:hypothetical protein n=1 Tax=Rickettsiella massiliensis TaxID=676517 RepID=UPI0012E9F30C|nr:hypothetical protein [Rickettsiella massiliensis]
MDNAWMAANQEILNCLKFDYQIITWDKLLENKEEFETFLVQVKNDYSFKDNDFRSKVLQHSGGYYAEKLYAKLKQNMPDITLSACQEAAINYVLDECAVLVSLNRLADYLIYPGKVNLCFEHSYKKMAKSEEICIEFKEYNLKPIVQKSSLPFEGNNSLNIDFFSKKEISKRKTRLEVSNKTKNFLKNASFSKIRTFIEDFDKLLSKLNNKEESCRQRRLSL